MTASIESRYRRALRFYPRSWRAEHEQEVIDILRDVATGHERGELRSLVANGVATRLDAILPATVRDRVATVAVATGTAYSIIYLMFHGWAPFAAEPRPGFATFGPFINPGAIVNLLWILGALFAFVGHYRVTRFALAASFILDVVIAVYSHLPGVPATFGPYLGTLWLFASLAVLSMIGTPRSRWMLGAGLTTVTGLFAAVYFTTFASGTPITYLFSERWLWTPSEFGPVKLGALLLAALAVILAALYVRRMIFAGIVAVSTVPWIGMWVAAVYAWWRIDGMAILVVLVVLIAVPALVLFGLRRAGFDVVVQRVGHPSRDQ